MSNTEFASNVKRIADDVIEIGRFGEKIWIAALWIVAKRDRAFRGHTEASFKSALVAAHRAGQLSLSRCDLVCEFSPMMVAASETRYMNAEFHFVRA